VLRFVGAAQLPVAPTNHLYNKYLPPLSLLIGKKKKKKGYLSLASPPPLTALLPVHHHPRSPHALTLLAPPVASSRKSAAALPACPVASPRHSDYFDPRAPPPPRGDGGYGRAPNGAQDGRVFTSYSIYKGKAALSFDPRPHISSAP